MQKCSLAVDIGASSGRLIAGYLQDGKMILDEVHRFENKIIEKEGYFCWDVEKLFSEIKKGIRKTKKQGFAPESIGIDTWRSEERRVGKEGRCRWWQQLCKEKWEGAKGH